MRSKQAVNAAIEAARRGELAKIFSGEALNNLNLASSRKNQPARDGAPSVQTAENLNNLKRPDGKPRGGVPRLTLYTDETFKKAMSWGIEEWLVQVCIRDYGEYKVRATINRIYQIPDGYFKPQYGPIPGQRGRLFNKEMQKLKGGNQKQ